MSTRQKQPKPLKYSDSGVDIDAGDALIGDISPHAKRTRRAGAESDLGGFGGLFDLRAAGFTDPILVAATDGVGTKLELANKPACIAVLALIWSPCVQMTFWRKAQCRCFSSTILQQESWIGPWQPK